MTIDEGLRDLKSLLGLEQIMNKKREHMETMIALVLLAYAIGLLVGEALRERVYRKKTEALLRSLHLAEAQGGVAS